MKWRALGEARWILGILAVCCAVSLAWHPAAAVFFAGFFLFSLYFFRDPERQPPGDQNLVVAPADGIVVEVKEAGEDHLIQGKVKRVAIFLILDVHVNARLPANSPRSSHRRFPVREIVQRWC
jgi:phosphatidylserine decarboxylase